MLYRVDESGGEVALSGERTSLVRLCAQITGDAEAAEDLAKETFVKALRHEPTARSG